MSSFSHVPGNLYLIMEGVRRAKAAHLHGHHHIRTEVVDRSGVSLGEGEIPIDSLRSPKRLIRRVTPSQLSRWQRAEEGAENAPFPFPPIVIQPTQRRGTSLQDVGFDFGGVP